VGCLVLVNIGKYEVLNAKAVKQIMFFLREQFCFDEKLDYVFVLSKKEKVFLINRDVELLDFDKLRVDALGLYFGKFYKDGFRLSIEGSQLIGDRCNCNVVEINQEEKHDWFKGFDVRIGVESGFVILKNESDFLGCAKVKDFIAFNSVSSSRKLKNVNEELN